jgi:predicted secreted protein
MDAIMVQTCSRCSRANPPGAVYCYNDGTSLGGSGGPGGPVAIGSRPFPSPFVFPTGRSCRSFDELARACCDEWTTARDLLQQGYLGSFFGGMGRLDLAAVAKESATFPDHDRGLDQLLSRLPSEVLAAPKLRLDPLEVNLGVLKPGEERSFSLQLENRGERLLYGSVTCSDGIWLAVGDGAAGAEKHFQTTHELNIPIRVRGDKLQARAKPQEAHLLVDSNGGQVKVVVRCEVPIKPFPSGLLAGAKAPRQVAELCMKSPKEAGALFEAGQVEQWYKSNGWVYPVKIPAASGLAAVQQFFEALGFTKPPKVEINTEEFSLKADPGESLSATLEVSTNEKKPVYAHATSEVPWLECGRARCNGRIASITVTIPRVPNKPGQLLETQVVVHANGNQRFIVPVTIQISGNRSSFDFDEPEIVEPEVMEPEVMEPVVMEPEVVLPATVASSAVMVEGDGDLDFSAPAPPPSRSGRESADRPAARPARGRKQEETPALAHVIPAGLLVVALLGVMGFDLLFNKGSAENVPDSGLKPTDREGWNYDVAKLRDPIPRLAVQMSDSQRFGIQLRDPKNNDSTHWKKLLFDVQGKTNNTCIKIDGSEYIFGQKTNDNVWVQGRQRKELSKPRIGWESTMLFKQEQVLVTQHIEVVPSETGLLDTCLIYYHVHNESTAPHIVGVRILLDTYIGTRDDVPFTVPGHTGFVTNDQEFTGTKIPDYVEAIENDPPTDKNEKYDPGTTVRINLKGIRLPGLSLVEPDRLRVCQLPNTRNAKWEWDLQKEGLKQTGKPFDNDSSIAVYWPYKELASKESRDMAITFGLGSLDVGDQLAVSAPSSVVPDREFTVTVYAWNATKGQTVKLELADGLVLASGEKAEKTVTESGARAQVFWRVRATKVGAQEITATSGRGKSAPRKVEVKGTSIFG